MTRGTSRRWMKGGYEHEIRITVQCLAHKEHAKILRFDAAMGWEMAVTIGAILDGSSKHYITRPGPNSPLGKCATCGAGLEASIEERQNHAESIDQIDQPGGHPR